MWNMPETALLMVCEVLQTSIKRNFSICDKNICHLFMSNFFILTICSAIFCYTTEDNRLVPALPSPSGNIVECHDIVEFSTAISNLDSGQTILLHPGTYYAVGPYGELAIDQPNVTIRGTTGDPKDVIVRGYGFESCTRPDEEILMLYAPNITLADFTITESRCHAVKFQANSNDSTFIHNMRFVNIGERCIKASNPEYIYGVTIQYCHFENNKIPEADRCSAHDAGNYIAGMDVMRGDSWVIKNNYFKGIKGATQGARGGIFIWGMSRNMTVEANTLIDLDQGICFGNPNGSHVIGGTIRNNYVLPASGQGISTSHCIDIKIYNNTIAPVLATNSRAAYFYDIGDGNEFKNNILFGAFTVNTGITPDTSNNYISGAAFAAAFPYFTDQPNGDLSLKIYTSVLVGRGDSTLDVLYDWEGDARVGKVDIGADQRISDISVEANSQIEDVVDKISVSPNPFNPSTVITVQRHVKSKTITAQIYNSRGRLVETLGPNRVTNKTSKQNGHWSRVAFAWTASSQPSGIYIVKAKIGNKILTKRITLNK